MLFSLFGMVTLRALFDEIVNLSKAISEKVNIRQPSEDKTDEKSEMERLIRSFNSIDGQFSNTFRLLEKKASDISILKELSDLCYVTFDSEEIMYVTLERALAITDSEIGSILMFDKQDKSAFVVKASIGLGEHVRIGDKIDFDTSIAKYAVINKTPLVVQDIEKDSRFGRRNRPQYGTKSFVCMPIKTSKDIIGVLTLSRRDQIRGYFPEDIEPLIPLLSNAAFTYENLRLLRDNERLEKHIRTIGKIFKILSSGLRDSELIHTLLNELRIVVNFDLAIVLMRDENHPDHLVLTDFIGDTARLIRGNSYFYDDSVIAAVFKQRSSLMISDIAALVCDTDKELLAAPGIKAIILTPLCTDGIVKGILAFCSGETHAFVQSKAMIERLSKVISLAIERDHLRSSVFKRKQELDSIRQIGRALASSTFDLEKVLDYTLDMIRIMMNAEAGTLYLTRDNVIETALSFNIMGKAPDKFRMKMGQGIAGHVAAGGEAVIIADAKASAHFYPDIDKETGFDTRSVLCVPMISQGKVIGVLQVINKINGAFSNNDEELLQSIASSVSIAIENARLYKETVSMAEHERDIRRMFQKFVPKEIVDKIIYGDNSGKIVLNELKTVTLLNIDIRGFSLIARKSVRRKQLPCSIIFCGNGRDCIQESWNY
ncbi:MAG: GAF domain-containing protein [Desulfobacteraceae bacterium]|nr:GAF domain-containing protein [Desulfobacteraceae bacterium]